jgi:hypothetical protein
LPGYLSLALAFTIMALGTPIKGLQMVFLGVSSVTSSPWIGDFVGSIRPL